ncbi:MAG: ATP-dependent Clp protease proteolytic subunit [Candidatus Latescibacteria bacterium]|jgi:ATP-dependent Clp protease, protease subunit|nr:ATP-dependent Clp protease proteolytic subunit [Candidatus Latescibacterota bacterium]MBT4138852.1 ATP-dependent Clp protease proteolytic subunit [Candidatus Latescibacterota bacterium]MBT5831718.1 ATP-dependent Clp protease proteolytic subunit [Candidatus Latescibacterota bacterium]
MKTEEKKETTPSGEFLVHGLHQSRTILISQQVDSKLTERIMASLLIMDQEDSEKPINVLINSPGGSADDGFAIYDALRFVRAPVRTINVGLSASAATVIMLGAEKEHRYALPNARIMIHQPLGQMPGTSAENVKRWAEQIIKLRKKINQLYADETGRPFEEIAQDTDRDRWFSPEEAVEYGLISHVIASYDDLPE